MSARSHSVGSRRARRAPSRPSARAAAVRRRRLALLGGLVALVALAGAVVWPLVHHAVKEVELPLRHEDIIRQQARDKHLDPALLAGVIYTESHFIDRTSPAGAKGLMQLMPGTAKFIAQRSGGSAFELRDLSTPQVNIAYGAWYIRYLIRRYGGNDILAIAAYNGGEANVDRWLIRAARGGRALDARQIPFPETRAYVERVQSARARYRRDYPRELGL